MKHNKYLVSCGQWTGHQDCELSAQCVRCNRISSVCFQAHVSSSYYSSRRSQSQLQVVANSYTAVSLHNLPTSPCIYVQRIQRLVEAQEMNFIIHYNPMVYQGRIRRPSTQHVVGSELGIPNSISKTAVGDFQPTHV